MLQSISVIPLPLPLGMGSVNCYLIRAGGGCVLIDTGAPNARSKLTSELQRLGCQPGSLRLTVLTHGDFDHIGNAVHVRTTFWCRLAMHPDDAPMAEQGDMFANRRRSNFLLKVFIPRLIGFGRSDRFTPDSFLEDGSGLSDYGLDAKAVWIPGHSKGSIGILTADGHFFCGDLFDNRKKPALNSLIDDRDTAVRSAAKVKALRVGTVYPGHGKPFMMSEISEGAT